MRSALSARRSATVTAVVALVASLMVLWAPARPADASLGFDNARMADIALSYVGQPGVNACLAAGKGTAYAGQCKQFVNCIIVLSGGPMPPSGDDYAGSFIAAGGTEISEGAATKGDIIQWGSGSTTSQHTAIVVANLGGGRFDVVDSNWGTPGLMVKHHTIANIHADIFNGAGAQPTRFIRMGTVNASPPDRDHDGVPDASDRCPDQPGSAATGGCPDTDGDTVADLDDRCPTMPGRPALLGCSEEDINPMPGPAADFDGDAKADYCRRVGAAYPQSRVQCTLSTGTGFGKTITSPVLDWGYDTGRAWIDFDGDTKADYCRRVGGTNGVNSYVSCTLSTGTGFGKTITSPVLDWGYDTGRAWIDFDGDTKADYCRRVGGTNGVNSYVSCTLSTGTGFGKTITSPVIDWGYDTGRAWIDFDGDAKADYCRVVGSTNGGDSKLACIVSTGTGFGKTITSPVIDWGYDTGRAWIDFDGDAKADYCRRVGAAYPQSRVQCTLSTGTGFGKTITSPVLDWGYDTGRAWIDFDGDTKADYCRRVGGTNGVNSYVSCTLSTGTGFGKTITSPVLDWGYDTGRAWIDFDGDTKADYCRRVGGTNGVNSYVSCTLSTGTGFGKTITSPVIDWGYDTGRAWIGSSQRYPRTGQGTTAPPGAAPGTSPQAKKKLSRPHKITVKRISRKQVIIRWKRVPRATGYFIRLANPAALRTSWRQVQKPRAKVPLRSGRHAVVAVRAVGHNGMGPVSKRRA